MVNFSARTGYGADGWDCSCNDGELNSQAYKAPCTSRSLDPNRLYLNPLYFPIFWFRINNAEDGRSVQVKDTPYLCVGVIL